MRNFLSACLLLLLGVSMQKNVLAQQGNVWTLGVNAKVDFNTTTPTVGTCSISSYEGCASISDNTGNLLFYTDGINIWNSSNTLVASGLLGNASTAQSGIIVPRPGTTPGSNTGDYYIFSLPQLGSERARYTMYNPILGVVSSLNTTLPDHATAAFTTESITVARHCNGIDYWVITHEVGNSRFKAYLLTNTGISMPVVTSIGPVATAIPNVNTACYMKMSPTNDKLAFMVRKTSVNLFDFNPSTGVVSNAVSVVTGTSRDYYGVEFSPNGSVLYYTDVFTGLYKYNITTPATTALATTFGTANNLYGALQLAPDGQIYMAKDGDSNMSNLNQPSLGVISNPNSFAGSTFNSSGLMLASGTASKCGLPNIIPSLNIQPISISGVSTICNGSNTTLTASGATNYTWSPATGLNTTTGSTVIASPSSTQTYTVTGTVNGCTVSKQITINVEQCCFAATDPSFTTISSDPNYTTHTVLSGKYYVAPGVVITVDGTTLDMTNVDMVFDQCAGIRFINSAEVLSYNSVFRTCDETQSWLGFYFSGSHGNISESTFKNAQKAIRLENGSSVRITNNNFLNNQIGVYAFLNTQFDAISGNTFTTNNVDVDYQSCQNTFGNTDIFAIWSRRSDFNDVISQNEFVNSDNENTKNVYGIYLINQTRNANISFNSFTNQFTSVYASEAINLELKNNTVELTQLYTYPGIPGNDIQFYLLRGTLSANVTGNIFKGKANYSNFGIYVDQSTGIELATNELHHFQTSIQIANSRSINVINNQLENTNIGIYSLDNLSSYFGCNVINCFDNTASGIEFWQNTNENANCRIIGNCIYNTETAIYLDKSNASGTGTLPYIRNNFLYSYNKFGVYNSNFNGNIGSGLTGLTAGKNTFASNNVAGGATDIVSNTPLTAFGNYGITNIGSGITLVGNNSYYSTSSCGNQLGNATTQYSPDDLCVTSADGFKSNLIVENGTLMNNFDAKLNALSVEDQVIVLKSAAVELAATTTTADMTALHNYLTGSTLTTNDQLWILSALYFKQPSVSLNYLASIDGMQELVDVESINLYTMSNPMTSEQWNQLFIIQDGNSDYRETAREALNGYGGRYPYRLKSTPVKSTDGATMVSNSVLENSMIVFPNPANNSVSLQFSLPENTGSRFALTDLSGKTIQEFDISEDFKLVELDLSALKNGMYILSILQSDKSILTQKLTVLH